MTAHQILLILFAVFTCLAAFNVPAHPRVTWGWLGVFCWALSILFI